MCQKLCVFWSFTRIKWPQPNFEQILPSWSKSQPDLIFIRLCKQIRGRSQTSFTRQGRQVHYVENTPNVSWSASSMWWKHCIVRKKNYMRLAMCRNLCVFWSFTRIKWPQPNFEYRMRAIITRSRFETAHDYKPRILGLRKVSC